jgi:hypothetical protein
MANNKEDTSQNLWTIFFIILFSLFVLTSSGNPESHATSSIKYPAQYELVFGDISSHRDAVLFNTVRLPDLQKHCGCALQNTSLNPFSIQNKISGYNRRIVQNFILIQKITLSIEPVLPWKLYFHPPSDEDDYLPALS